jgi:hypothetical protein
MEFATHAGIRALKNSLLLFISPLMMMYKLKADETNRSVRKTNTEYENT